MLLAAAVSSNAEDADRFRPYLRFHSGDIAPLWEVDDHWSFGLGANFNGLFGGELALDYFERDYDYADLGTLGEVSAWNIVPEVRLRKPLLKKKLVPYVLAGIGPSFLQFNDSKPSGFDHDIDIDGLTFAVGVGGGIEYFIADNVTFGIEGKYIWINPLESEIDGRKVDVDVSSATFTFGLRVYFDENEPRPMAWTDSKHPNRFYFGVRVGASIPTDEEVENGVSLGPEPAAWGNVANQTGGLVLGADFGPRFGVELSLDSLEPNLELDGLGVMGEYGTGTAIPQLRVRFPFSNRRLVPYVLGGVGAMYAEFNDARPQETHIDVDAKGIYPALRLGAGLEYFLARNFSFNADAGWVYSWGHEVEIVGDRKAQGDFSAFMLTLGFRVYLFEF
jgi:opacity protein-like surface antigen